MDKVSISDDPQIWATKPKRKFRQDEGAMSVYSNGGKKNLIEMAEVKCGVRTYSLPKDKLNCPPDKFGLCLCPAIKGHVNFELLTFERMAACHFSLIFNSIF